MAYDASIPNTPFGSFQHWCPSFPVHVGSTANMALLPDHSEQIENKKNKRLILYLQFLQSTFRRSEFLAYTVFLSLQKKKKSHLVFYFDRFTGSYVALIFIA